MYFEGYITQLAEVIMSSMHQPIINKYSSIFKTTDVLLNNIIDILKKYDIVVESDIGTAIRTILQEPDAKKVDSLRGRFKYCANQIIKDYNQEKSDYLAGKLKGIVATGVSPYSYLESEKITSGKTEEELIEIHDKKFSEWAERVKMQKLKSSDEASICDYPYLGFYKEARLKKFYAVDMEFNVLKVVLTHNLKDFYELKPQSSSEIGLYFSNGRASTKGRTYDEELPEKGSGVPKFLNSVSDMLPNVYYIDTVLDEKASELVNYLATGCYNNYFISKRENQDVRGVMETAGKLKDLVSIVYPDTEKPSLSHYDALRAYLHKLKKVEIISKTEKGGDDSDEQIVVLENSIFDTVEISSDKSENTDRIYYRVELGQKFTRDLIEARVSTIIKPTIEMLKENIARLLYQDMKPHRLYDVMEVGNQEADHFYTVERLQLMARVPGSRAVKIKKYTAAIDELKEKRILVKDYKIIKGATAGFTITWLPLSKTEYSDVLYYDNEQRDWIAAQN